MQNNSVNRKHLIFLIKGSLEKNVPIITQITVASEKGHCVSVICTNCDRRLRKILHHKGVNLYHSKHPVIGVPVIRKVMDWLGVRLQFYRILLKIYTPGDLLYIGSLDTALSMGKKLLKYDYILHIRELYDKYPHYLHLIKPYAQIAKVVVIPEYCRAAILKTWLCLKKPPLVIPNKPYEHPRVKNGYIHNKKARKIIEKLKGKKIILYQGNISRDRGLTNILKAISQCIDEQYALILMGVNHKNYVEEIKKECKGIYHIDYMAAPFHLEVTSHAHIGLVAYDESSLNNIFCAPNKIYEYSGFGIPVLGNDIPGLRYTIGNSGAGLCVNFSNPEEVKNAIYLFEERYGRYSKKAKEFFDHTDLGEIFDKMLHSFYGV